MNSATAFRIAAIVGFFAVALGAFGAHGLKDLLAKNQTLAIWEKAVLYHLVHAAVLLFVARRAPLPVVAWFLILFGVVIFSGSLYVLAFTGVRWLGAITPIGGVCLLGGWLALALRRWES
jgi:uncharacterized membrane protein YgdD (TMEM256/DUF423 family)